MPRDLRMTLLSLHDHMQMAASVLKKAKEGERDHVILAIPKGQAKQIAGTLEWYAEWLLKITPFICKYLSGKKEVENA